MSDNDNVWNRPKAPPPPLFTGKKEKDLAKQVSDEISERVVKSALVYYPISVKHTNFHDLYGEAIDKNFLPPVKIDAYVEWNGEETTTDSFGIEKKSSITIHFQKRRLTEDKNLFVREGDYVYYGNHYYEVVTLQQPRLLFGQIDEKIEIAAKCVRARDGAFPKHDYVASEEEDPRLIADAYDPVNEISIVESSGDVNGAICKDDQVKHNEYTTQDNPPPPLFTGKKERDLTKQVGDELLERVIGQQVVYFPVSIKHSNYHDLYGESIDKTFLPPMRIFAAVEWLGSDTETTYLGLDKTSKISVKFHKKRLTEDQNLFVREGDYLLYGTVLYEITILKSPRLLFGQVNNKYEIIAECIRARQGVFTLSKKKVPSGDEIDENSLTACENASFIQKVEGEKNTVKNLGTGEGAFAKKVGSELQFKSFKAGDNVSVTSTANEITIATTATISGTISNAHTASLAHTASYVLGSNVTGAVALANTASYYAETDTLASVVTRGATTTGTLSVGGISASANVSASAFYGDGANITGVTAEWDGSHVGNATIQGSLSASSNVSASAFYGSGANLTSLTAGNIVGAIANATNAVTAQTASYILGSNVSGAVSLANTASYYVEADTLATVVARGAATAGTLSVAGISASSNISASAFYGDGSSLTGISTADNLHAVTSNGATTTNSITVAGLKSTSTLELSTSAGAFLISRLTTAQRGTLSPSNGMMIYNSTDSQFEFYQNNQWVTLGSGAGGGTSTVISTGNGILVLSDDGVGGSHRSLLDLYNVSASSYSSKIIYLANTASSPPGPFTLPRKFYFNENGTWFPSTFHSLNSSVSSTGSISKPDLHDILHLNGNNQEDRAILTNFNANSASYSGRAIYISNTGSSGSIGPFVRANKHYFNENGIWFPSVFGGL
jgi:hypothetical protein